MEASEPSEPPPPPPAKQRWQERIRTWGLPAVLLTAAVIFLVSVDFHYPIKHWLFWRYAAYWSWSALFAAACLCGGHLVLQRVLRLRLRLDQHLMFAFAIGVLVFHLGMFVGGVLQLYGRVFSLVWPLGLVAAGGRSLFTHLRPRLTRLWRRAERRTFLQRLGLACLAAFGIAGVGMLYFLILTPDNIAYDARWYHLSLAEQYALHGGLRRFDEGWYQSTFPHLSSFLYCWAFQLPGTILFDRLGVAAHLEFVLFLATLAGISVLVRWLIPGARGRFAWGAMFLFPGIFLYDSSLGVAADHVAALWAVPIYLALVRAWPALSPRPCILLAAMMAGAISTKYQTLSILAFPAAAVGVRAVVLLVRRRPQALVGPALAAAVGAALTAPHWLKNLIWYGDPFYPFFHKYLTVRPWTADSGHLVETVFRAQMWTPKGETLVARLLESGRALFTYSFFPNDWFKFHGAVPVFGSLFTLTLLVLPFLRPLRRLLPLVVATLMGIFVYYWTSHQDRYLQIILPWMAVAVAAVVTLVWRAGWAARGALAVLLGAQIVWGGDIYFIPTHAMIGGSPINSVVSLMSTGYRKDYKDRFLRLGPVAEVGKIIPPGSKVVVHEAQVILGLNAAAISDWGGWQGGISYGRMGSPGGVYRALKGMGATHLLWTPGLSREHDNLASDLLFFDFATRRTVDMQHVAGQTLARLPPLPPDDSSWNDRVLFLGCPGTYAPGLYRVGQLTVPHILPRQIIYPAPHERLSPSRPDEQWAQAGFAIVDPYCYQVPWIVSVRFRTLAQRGRLQLLARAH